MAQITQCDGCNGIATEQRGLVIQKDYCETCAEAIDKYLSARNDLHTGLMTQWEKGMELIKASYPDMVLPDE
jgi:hypothetical protein